MRATSAAMPPNQGFSVEPVREAMVGNVRSSLLVLVCAVALVLLIACANVANLLLARAISRSREIAIRAALGAARGRIIRQLLSESLLLSGGGVAAGWLLARWLLATVVKFSPEQVRRMGEIKLDAGVLVFTLVLSVLTGLLFAPIKKFTPSSMVCPGPAFLSCGAMITNPQEAMCFRKNV